MQNLVQSRFQLKLNQKKHETVASSKTEFKLKMEKNENSLLSYSANLQAYLPQKALWLRMDGEGDTKAFQAQNIEMRQKNWRMQFRGDLGYQNLLPNGQPFGRMAEPKCRGNGTTRVV